MEEGAGVRLKARSDSRNRSSPGLNAAIAAAATEGQEENVVDGKRCNTQ